MQSSTDKKTVLFLCTGNSARSILAEVLLNTLGSDRFDAYSAGSHPTGRVNPGALAELESRGLPTADLRSKSWEEFAGDDARAIDYVFTVCDNAAGETCPVWVGSPVTAHWGIPDPASVSESPEAVRAAFRQAYERLERRIGALLDLPLDEMSDVDAQTALNAIGTSSQ